MGGLRADRRPNRPLKDRLALAERVVTSRESPHSRRPPTGRRRRRERLHGRAGADGLRKGSRLGVEPGLAGHHFSLASRRVAGTGDRVAGGLQLRRLGRGDTRGARGRSGPRPAPAPAAGPRRLSTRRRCSTSPPSWSSWRDVVVVAGVATLVSELPPRVTHAIAARTATTIPPARAPIKKSRRSRTGRWCVRPRVLVGVGGILVISSSRDGVRSDSLHHSVPSSSEGDSVGGARAHPGGTSPSNTCPSTRCRPPPAVAMLPAGIRRPAGRHRVAVVTHVHPRGLRTGHHWRARCSRAGLKPLLQHERVDHCSFRHRSRRSWGRRAGSAAQVVG